LHVGARIPQIRTLRGTRSVNGVVFGKYGNLAEVITLGAGEINESLEKIVIVLLKGSEAPRF